jgi:hypothetical protein
VTKRKTLQTYTHRWTHGHPLPLLAECTPWLQSTQKLLPLTPVDLHTIALSLSLSLSRSLCLTRFRVCACYESSFYGFVGHRRSSWGARIAPTQYCLCKSGEHTRFYKPKLSALSPLSLCVRLNSFRVCACCEPSPSRVLWGPRRSSRDGLYQHTVSLESTNLTSHTLHFLPFAEIEGKDTFSYPLAFCSASEGVLWVPLLVIRYFTFSMHPSFLPSHMISQNL